MDEMFALVTDQGTAMSETALCGDCYPIEVNQGYGEYNAGQADDWDESAGWVNCSENGALECIIHNP